MVLPALRKQGRQFDSNSAISLATDTTLHKGIGISLAVGLSAG